MSEVKNATVPDLSFHKEDLPLTYKIIVRATTGRDPESKDGCHDEADKKPIDQIEEIRQLSKIINHPRVLAACDLIPDIFLNEDTGLYQYLSGRNVSGFRWMGGESWSPISADDHTLRRNDQESYICHIIIPAIAGMAVEQLSPKNTELVEDMEAGIVHALMDVAVQALRIAPDKLKEREDNVKKHLWNLLSLKV